MDILIVYGTRHGWTRTSSEVIQQELSEHYGHNVELSDYRISREVKQHLSTYDLVITGSSIQASFWKSGVKRFLKKYRGEFKKLAIFVCAGGTIQAARTGKMSLEDAINQAKTNYIDPVKQKLGISTIADGVFGGQYGKPPKVKFNSWDKKDVVEWVREIQYNITG